QPGVSYDFRQAVGTTTVQCSDALGLLARRTTLPDIETIDFGLSHATDVILQADQTYTLFPESGTLAGNTGQAIMAMPLVWTTDALSLFQTLAQSDGGHF